MNRPKSPERDPHGKDRGPCRVSAPAKPMGHGEKGEDLEHPPEDFCERERKESPGQDEGQTPGRIPEHHALRPSERVWVTPLKQVSACAPKNLEVVPIKISIPD